MLSYLIADLCSLISSANKVMSTTMFFGKNKHKYIKQNRCSAPQNKSTPGFLLEKVISVLPNILNYGKMFT